MTRTLQIVDGDVVIRRSSGRLAFIVDKPKATQDIHRLLALDEPWGAGLDQLIGTVPESEFALSARAQRNIRRSFDELVRLQRGSQLADRTAAERLSSLQRMYVVPANFGGGTSKTGYALRVDAVTVRGELVRAGSLLAAPSGG